MPTVRERMWRAKTNEGGEANLKLLAEIAQLRKEYATLFGAPSYADFALRRRMADNAGNASRFLDEVRAAVSAREQRELDELRDAKARELGLPVADVKLDRWDVAYYTERVKRERYSVDQEAFRPYFPPQESLAFVMRLIEKMMGVRYTRVDGVTLWHAEAQAYAVSDAASGKPLATLYVDLYPREGKYNHAAVWPHPQRLAAPATRTAGGTGDQPRSPGPDARRDGNTAARVRPRGAQQPVGHAPFIAGHERAARLRRGAVADARGVGLRPRVCSI